MDKHPVWCECDPCYRQKSSEIERLNSQEELRQLKRFEDALMSLCSISELRERFGEKTYRFLESLPKGRRMEAVELRKSQKLNRNGPEAGRFTGKAPAPENTMGLIWSRLRKKKATYEYQPRTNGVLDNQPNLIWY